MAKEDAVLRKKDAALIILPAPLVSGADGDKKQAAFKSPFGMSFSWTYSTSYDC
jgi:hypothetical protein